MLAALINRYAISSNTLSLRLLHLTRYRTRRFVVQLHSGCGHAECATPFCHAGKTRLAHSKPRVYTLVSARAMAVELATSPCPIKYICPYITVSQIDQASTEAQQEIDPKSVVQRLFNTEAFRKFLASGVSTQDAHEPSESNTANPQKTSLTTEPESVSFSCGDLIGARSRLASFKHHQRMLSPSRKDISALLADDMILSPETRSILFSLSDFSTVASSFQDAHEIWDDGMLHDLPAIRMDHAFRAWSKGAQILIFDSMSRAVASFSHVLTGDTSLLQQECSSGQDDAVIHVVDTAIHALTASIPRAKRDTWHVVWSTIVNGRAYGKQRYRKSDVFSSPWLHILDAFESEPGHRLLNSLVRTVAVRRQMEDQASSAKELRDRRLELSDTLRERTISSLINEERSVRLAKFGTQQRVETQHGKPLLGTTPLLWLEWLRKCFLKHWNGALRLDRYGIAETALGLMEDICKAGHCV